MRLLRTLRSFGRKAPVWFNPDENHTKLENE